MRIFVLDHCLILIMLLFVHTHYKFVTVLKGIRVKNAIKLFIKEITTWTYVINITSVLVSVSQTRAATAKVAFACTVVLLF